MANHISGVESGDNNSKGPADADALNKKNWLNLFSFVINCGLTYGSTAGIFGPTNTELSAKYQTIVTPAGWAFAIWGPIFIWEGIFAVAQMLPRFRGHKVVQEGIGYWWVALCVVQVVWSVVFAQEVIWLSLFAMLGILVTLVAIITRCYGIETDYSGYYLLKAPFQLQCGWIIAASVVNLNVCFIKYAVIKDFSNHTAAVAAMDAESVPPMLLGVAFASLALVFVAALVCSAVPQPQIIVVGVAAWASGAVASERRCKAPACPEEELVRMVFTPEAIEQVATLATAIAVTSAVLVGLLVAKVVYRQFIAPPQAAGGDGAFQSLAGDHATTYGGTTKGGQSNV